jgi:HK97 family phage major capsid protein
MGRLEERRQQLTTLLAEDKQFWDDAGDHDLDSKTLQDVDARNKKIADLDAEVTELMKAEGAKARNEALRQSLTTPAGRLPTPGYSAEQKNGHQPQPQGTLGEQFTQNAEFKAWLEGIAPGGRIGSKTRVQSPAVQFKTLITGASATSAGALVDTQFFGLRDTGVAQRPLTIRDVITTGQTDSDTIEYVRMGTFTNAAAPVAEATATSGSTGAKPESAMPLSVVTESVKTIAHWIPATRRALADAGQLRTLIDNFLRYGLEEELEDQIINGDGTGENFTGLLNISGTTSQAYDATGTPLLTTTRKARTLVRTTGRATPTAYVMHPLDWQAIDLLQDAEDRYFFGGPMVMGTPRLWGLPVIESEGMTQGVAMVADWRLAVLWDRQQAQILTSDSHSDFFIRNLIAILAEMRAGFGVLRPAAFVEIDLTA